MGWTKYEIFSVISGIVLLAGAVGVRGQRLRERAMFAAGGGALIWYGWHVAHATSGVYTFPVEIFIIPFAGVAVLAYKAWQGATREPRAGARGTEGAPARTSSSPEAGEGAGPGAGGGPGA